ncbi:MAG: histidine--tRNA ligase [Candidatus Aenigmarchaeota archaeon]|nr:histidine--tRNA ligase [Candidatus Aenigmarchaeota archaeon]
MREEFQPVKGTRDFLPEDKIIRQRIVDTLREVFETFGFSPLETPSLERWEILSRKYAGGEEILKETYRLKDQGGRELGLRYDLTVPFCRVIAANPEIPKPFKRYQIGRVWRDGPIKLGRYREFWQCDVDVAGSSSMMADAEFLKMIDVVAEKFGINADIRVSNRKLLNSILDYAGVQEEKRLSVTLSIDKLEKIGRDGVVEELISKGIDEESVKKIIELISINGTNDEILKIFKGIKEAREGVEELDELIKYTKILGLKNVRIVPSLARGLAYYTGTIFEAFIKNSNITSSFAGGGRYDDLIGKFTGVDKIPAVGVSFGLDVLSDALKEKMERNKTVVSVFVIPINTKEKSMEIVSMLRDAGINSDVDTIGRSLSKNLNYVNSLNIPYCLIVGKREIDEDSVKLRDMNTGEEKLINIRDVAKEVKKLID